MPETSDMPELHRARNALRDLQAQVSDWPGTASGRPVLPEAVEYLSTWPAAREAFAAASGAALPYPQSRLLRTRRIIERIEPGPLEHTQLIVTLAWQAAAIEAELEHRAPVDTGNMAPPPIFGTIAEPRSHAWSQVFAGVPVIVLSAGMITSVYSLAKASVLSWPRASDGNPPGGIAFSARKRDLETRLAEDSVSADLLLDVVRNWLQHGLPVPTRPFPVPEELQTPLATVVGMCERFVLAHEYAHAHHDLFRTPIAISDPDRERRADRLAAACIVGSAGSQDDLDPDIALQGCLLAMAVHEIIDALLTMTHGGPPPVQPGYPAFAERAGLILDHSRAALDAAGAGGRAAPAVATVAASALHELWRRIADRVERELRGGLTLHPIWTRPYQWEGLT